MRIGVCRERGALLGPVAFREASLTLHRNSRNATEGVPYRLPVRQMRKLFFGRPFAVICHANDELEARRVSEVQPGPSLANALGFRGRAAHS
jgi:hypothetical protein